MRRDVLYEYDLPIELLDDIPDTEEALEVFYARSDQGVLLPILYTRERIVWAYPETSTVYRVYQLQYIDLVSAYAKHVVPPFPVLRFNTVDGQTYHFSRIEDGKEEMLGKFITLCGILKSKVGGDWHVWRKKTLLADEFYLDKEDHADAEKIAGITLCDPSSRCPSPDVFEDKPIPGKGCFESNEVLFSHFPTAGPDDVFEEPAADAQKEPEDPYAGKDAKIARIVEEVEAEIQKASTDESPKEEEKEPANDAVIYSTSSGKSDDLQWGEVNDGGDAEILADTRYLKRIEKIIQPKSEYGPEDDDSVVYAQPKAAKSKDACKEEITDRAGPKYSKDDDDSIVYPTGNDEPVVITPMKKSEWIEVDDHENSLPSHSVQIDVSEVRQKTPFEEANKDVITRVPVRETGTESASLSDSVNHDSLLPFQQASTLQPRPEFDQVTVDKLLAELKSLYENGVITEEEYKERSLTLFRKDQS